MEKLQLDYKKMWEETFKALAERKRVEESYFELVHDTGELLPYLIRLTDDNTLNSCDLIDQCKYLKTMISFLKVCKEICEKYDLELEDANG